MLGTVARDSSRGDLSPFRCEIPKCPWFLILDRKVAIRTKPTYFSSMIGLLEFASAITAVFSIKRHFRPLYPYQFHPFLLSLIPS